MMQLEVVSETPMTMSILILMLGGIQYTCLTGRCELVQAEAAAQDAAEKFTRDLARAASAAAADLSAKVRWLSLMKLICVTTIHVV